MTSIKQNTNLFMQSIKTMNKSFINAILFDLLGYALFFGALAGFYAMFGFITEGTPAAIMSNFVYVLLLIVISIITVAIIALSVAIFKRISYKITNSAQNHNSQSHNNLPHTNHVTLPFKNYFLISFIWTAIWFILFVIFALIMKESILPIVMFGLCLVYIYLTAILRANMKKSAIETFKTLFDRVILIHKYIIPLILILAVGWVFAFIVGLLGYVNIQLLLGVGIIMALIYITWARHYFGLVQRSIDNE